MLKGTSLEKEVSNIFSEADFEIIDEFIENGKIKITDFKKQRNIKLDIDIIASDKISNSKILITCASKGEDVDGLLKDWIVEIPRVKLIGDEILRVLLVITGQDIEKYRLEAKKSKIEIWDNDVLEAYKNNVELLGKFSKNAILKDLWVERKTSRKFEHIRVIKINQNNKTFYVFSMKIGTLLEIAYVYRRSSKMGDAYQRQLKSKKLEKIREYIRNAKGIFPNNIILSLEGAKEYKSNRKADPDNPITIHDTEFVTLLIPIGYCSAWIVDGQHRLFGFKDIYNEFSNFEVVITGFIDPPPEFSGETFININYTQTKIDPSLRCDILTIVDKNEKYPETRPSKIVKMLNSQNGPWENKIRVYETQKNRYITLVSFSSYAFKELTSKNGALTVKFPAIDDQFRVVSKYFSIIYNLFYSKNNKNNQWDNIKNYALTQTSGVNALLYLLMRILENDNLREKLDKEKRHVMKNFLRPLTQIKFTKRFVKKCGGGFDGFRTLANRMINVLNKVNSTRLMSFKTKRKRKR